MSSSSTVPQCRPHVSELLSKLIATQNMDTRLWLRAEMVRLVDPMIDSLFLGLLIFSSAQPSKQTNIHSTMSELCQLIEGEKETTNRLVRGQMDRLVNSLFLRLTNKALVNTEVSAFASVQPSPSNHQTVPPNASIAQSRNNSIENLSTNQITCPPLISSSLSDGQNANILFDGFEDVKKEYDDDECEDCGLDGENDDEDKDNAETDTQIGLGKEEIGQDQQNASLESDLTVTPNVIDNSNQSANYVNDFSLINKSEPQIRSITKSTRNATKKKYLENGQSSHPVIEHNHQSTPSTSGLRSTTSKRNPKKICEDAQTNVNVRKSEKRKSGKATKNVKIGKRKRILDDDEDIDADDRDDQEDHANIGAEITTTNPIQPNLAQPNRHWQCSHCHKSFQCNSALQIHLRVHTGERPFRCDQCDKRFSVKTNLTTHKLIHQNIKRFQCDQCDKQFSLKGNLAKHQLIHQNIKRFRCHECDKQFIQKCNLDSHLLIHSGERPFACRHCAKSFTDMGIRSRHEQAIHLHVKPYRCKQCGYTATQRAAVIQHIRMVHFGLPKSIKQQRVLNVIDERDPRELMEKV